MKDSNIKKDQIVIIRRAPRDDEGESHGGAWKIAYADFVTAMMAFFLVMWLINVTSDETKISIASYFNPIKFSQLGDNPLSDKENTEESSEDKKNNKKTKSGDTAKENLEGQEQKEGTGKAQALLRNYMSEEKLMLDPYDALDQIAAAQEHIANGASTEKDGKNSSKKGDAYRDFIIPQYTAAVPEQAKEVLGKREKPDGPNSLDISSHYLNGRSVITINKPLKEELDAKIEKFVPRQATGTSKKEKELKERLAKAGLLAPNSEGDTKGEAASVSEHSQTALAIKSELMAIAQMGENKSSDPALNVALESDGLLLQLTDKTKYSMFAIGSSRPNKSLIDMMAKIAKVLNKTKGMIVIRGHTDARPYRNKHYDNWQLSTARAQMVYYMLKRAGFDMNRVTRIEGHADKDLQNVLDPNAAENRRIEILLELPKQEKQK